MLSVAAAMITVTMGGRMVTDFVVTMATCVFFFLFLPISDLNAVVRSLMERGEN